MKVKLIVPEYVQKVVRILGKEGFQCYLAGGAVRDVLTGVIPDDYDLATNAVPEQMLQIFPKSVSTGAKFGMVSALIQDKKGETHDVQVTTFRSEEQYVDGRWPSKVEFINEIDKDLARRDFTINAMAIDLTQYELSGEETELEWDVHDPFNGEQDLAIGVVRAVGTPIERFLEDGLRTFRACRMASQLQFDIEDETFQAITEAIPVAKMVSMERVRDEFMKMLMNSPKPSIGLDLMRRCGLLEIFLPELLEGWQIEQKINHSDDVYWHSLRTCDVAPDNIKVAALLHDIGKPRCDMGNGHFYGHASVGAKMSREILTRLRFPRVEIEKIAHLIDNHMFYYPVGDKNDQSGKPFDENEWSDAAVRRFIAKVGEDNIDELFQLRIADATSNPVAPFHAEEIAALSQRISEVRETDMALTISDLDITGQDIMELGVEKGPQVGVILEKLLDMVIEDPLVNTRERLVEEVRALVGRGIE